MPEVEKPEEEDLMGAIGEEKGSRYLVQNSSGKRYTVTPKEDKVKWKDVKMRITIERATGKVIDRCEGGERERKYVKVSEDPIDMITIFEW